MKLCGAACGYRTRGCPLRQTACKSRWELLPELRHAARSAPNDEDKTGDLSCPCLPSCKGCMDSTPESNRFAGLPVVSPQARSEPLQQGAEPMHWTSTDYSVPCTTTVRYQDSRRRRWPMELIEMGLW